MQDLLLTCTICSGKTWQMCALAHQSGRHQGELVSHLLGKAQNLLWETGSFMLGVGADR